MGHLFIVAVSTGIGITAGWVSVPDIEQNGGNMRHWAFFVSLVVAGQVGTSAPVLAQHISGVNPATRPTSAPVITEFKKDGDWYVQALSGVTPPYPVSLKFLEDQGAWFNPFIRSGMPGPYDIRGWHKPK